MNVQLCGCGKLDKLTVDCLMVFILIGALIGKNNGKCGKFVNAAVWGIAQVMWLAWHGVTTS